MCKVYTGYCGTSEMEPVRSIIPSLKLEDYISVQAYKPCSISHLSSFFSCYSVILKITLLVENTKKMCSVYFELFLLFFYSFLVALLKKHPGFEMSR